MERVRQLIVDGNLDAESDYFWAAHWHDIASVKAPLEAKVAAYFALRSRDVVNINDAYTSELYNMALTDRHFMAKLDLGLYAMRCYHLCTICIDDDVAALTAHYQKIDLTECQYAMMNRGFHYVLLRLNSPRCMRFLLQGKDFREVVMQEQMSPLMQRVVEELVQPTDQLNETWLLAYGQSVKLIGMCVKDEELVDAWLKVSADYLWISYKYLSVTFVRKLHALATPDQRAMIKIEIWQMICADSVCDGGLELTQLLGLSGSRYPKIQACFLKNHVSAFPAFTFAMIVAMCDGYLAVTHGIKVPQRRFFDCMMRLPMDLQALVALRLWGHASTVIRGEHFDRAFLAVV